MTGQAAVRLNGVKVRSGELGISDRRQSRPLRRLNRRRSETADRRYRQGYSIVHDLLVDGPERSQESIDIHSAYIRG
jgi:hypothetical protein